jgi:replicative DNA helicase
VGGELRAHDLVERFAEAGSRHKVYEQGISRALMARIADEVPDQYLRDLDVPIIALSQLSRAVEQRTDKRPILSDLRESGSIEQDADLVMFIYRDEYYNEESDQQGLAEVICAKHRNGPTGAEKLSFLKRYAKFADLAA